MAGPFEPLFVCERLDSAVAECEGHTESIKVSGAIRSFPARNVLTVRTADTGDRLPDVSLRDRRGSVGLGRGAGRRVGTRGRARANIDGNLTCSVATTLEVTIQYAEKRQRPYYSAFITFRAESTIPQREQRSWAASVDFQIVRQAAQFEDFPTDSGMPGNP